MCFFSRSNRFFYYLFSTALVNFFCFIALLNRVNCNLYTLVEPTTFIDTRFGLMEFPYFNFDVFKHLFLADKACWRTTIFYWVDENMSPVDFRTTFILAPFSHTVHNVALFIKYLKHFDLLSIKIDHPHYHVHWR